MPAAALGAAAWGPALPAVVRLLSRTVHVLFHALYPLCWTGWWSAGQWSPHSSWAHAVIWWTVQIRKREVWASSCCNWSLWHSHQLGHSEHSWSHKAVLEAQVSVLRWLLDIRVTGLSGTLRLSFCVYEVCQVQVELFDGHADVMWLHTQRGVGALWTLH